VQHQPGQQFFKRISTIPVENGSSDEDDLKAEHLERRDYHPGWYEYCDETPSGNRKGCDIGYAPATSSCEEANSVDTRTVAALDVITAFAVPNPNCPSQDQSVFSGLVALQVALLSRSPSLLRTGKFYFANPFSRRREQN
jgi:hypothetical protein